MKKCSRPTEPGRGLGDRRGRSVPVAVLLVLVVLLSASSGVYAGASFFAQQAPNVTVTTTVYSTTTSWTTLIVWSAVTEVVQGVLTTAEYTTSTSTITVAASASSSTTASTSSSTTASPTRTGTSITITQVTGASGRVTVKGILKDVYGKGLQGLPLRVTVDGGYQGRLITGSGGSFTYYGLGPTFKGSHVVTVWFGGTTQYASSAASRSYYL